MQITTEQFAAITERIALCMSRAKLSQHTVQFSLRSDIGKTAGYAYQAECRIELNTQLLIDNFDEFMETTIPHEVAHIIQAHKFPRAKQAHGPEFRLICMQIGFPKAGRTHHNFDLSGVVTVKEKKRFQYACACTPNYFFSTRLHNAMERGEKRGCGTCHTVVNYTGNIEMMK